MAEFIILVETGADVPQDIAAQYGIRTVPMHVAFGDETRDDGTFPVEDVYRFYESTGTLTKTSGSTVGDFEKVFQEIQEEKPHAVILHLAYSAVTTCSYQSAIIAAEGRKNIISLDTKVVTAGQALVAILVARYVKANPDASVGQVVEEANRIIGLARMGFFPGDLAYLRAGGRVSNAAYLGAKILSLNPLIELLEGHLKATKKYRGRMEKVAPRFLQEYAADLDRSILAFVYSKGLKQSIMDECTTLAKEMGFAEILWIPTGGVVTTHCGPGGFGVCGIAKIDEM